MLQQELQPLQLYASNMYSSVTEWPSDQQSSSVPDSTTASIFPDSVAHSLDVVYVNSIFRRVSVTDETAGPAIRVKPIEVTAEKSVFWRCPSNEGKKPTLTTSILYPSDVSAHREEELSIIDDLYKLRAYFFSLCEIDADTRVNTNECGLDSIAVIRELVSSLISRADGIRTSLSALEESDVVERGSPRVWKSPHCLKLMRPQLRTPSSHRIRRTWAPVRTDFSQGKSSVNLVRAAEGQIQYEKRFSPGPFGVPAAPRHLTSCIICFKVEIKWINKL